MWGQNLLAEGFGMGLVGGERALGLGQGSVVQGFRGSGVLGFSSGFRGLGLGRDTNSQF